MVGILFSFWDGLFSGAMLVSGRVDTVNHMDVEILIWLKKQPTISGFSTWTYGRHPSSCFFGAKAQRKHLSFTVAFVLKVSYDSCTQHTNQRSQYTWILQICMYSVCLLDPFGRFCLGEKAEIIHTWKIQFWMIWSHLSSFQSHPGPLGTPTAQAPQKTGKPRHPAGQLRQPGRKIYRAKNSGMNHGINHQPPTSNVVWLVFWSINSMTKFCVFFSAAMVTSC